MIKFFTRISLLILTAFAVTSCGYRVGDIKPAQLEGVESIAIPLVKNDTLQPRTAQIVTGALISQMEQDGTYSIAQSETADAVLNGRVKSIERRQLRSARDNQLRSRELELRIEFEYELVEKATGDILSRGTFFSSTNVFVSANYQTAERQALPEAARQLAIDLTTRLTEGY
ncbi:LPS assembly lipoprotein LptE [Sulfuriroseicoccus oceanibius]|uniref:Lipoprotein n=1 Tax=Sulfuriroseicoccus oceanibius TaxID=2707525 RepID=A0A6B3LBI6_9BACT|nr:LPS assembly lipoprotein LptE [Sulfuriroseicoccus oceanibius]QQL44499.1 hypothetical protein G3M56_011500 [Sulfuriroseicoccus oceanibius]